MTIDNLVLRLHTVIDSEHRHTGHGRKAIGDVAMGARTADPERPAVQVEDAATGVGGRRDDPLAGHPGGRLVDEPREDGPPVGLDDSFLTAFGDSDPVTRGGEQRWIDSVPGAKGQKHTILEGAGHFIQDDAGDELAQIVVQFVTDNPV